jgi:hypothetical protein
MMKRISATLTAVAIATTAVAVMAQAKPNFAGKWVMEAPAAPPAGGAPGGGGGGRGGRGGGWGQNVTITQDATTMTVEYTQGENPVKLTYKLDGTESKNSMMGRGGQAMEQVSKAAWVADKLVITTTTQFGEQKRTLSVVGGNLVIENETPGREGGAPMTTKVTYKKA